MDAHPDRRPVPTGLGIAGCRAYTPSGPGGQPRPCGAAARWTGLVLRTATAERPAEAWRAFACDQHAEGLIGQRELLERDHTLLAEWREQAERWKPGHPRRPTLADPWIRPRPLATGAAALELITRARRWSMQRSGNDDREA